MKKNEVTQNGATERPFTGKYNEHHEAGLYFLLFLFT